MKRANTNLQKSAFGFSLIELLIVVAIIMVIAAIAVPNFLRSRSIANESAAVQAMRSVDTAELTYSTSFGTGFAPLINLGGATPCTSTSTTACILDELLSSGARSGYSIKTLAPGSLGTMAAPNVTYSVNAMPQTPGSTGVRSFCSDQTGVIRFDAAGATPPNPCDSTGLPNIQ